MDNLLTPQERLPIATAFKMLGALFRSSPSDSALDPFFNILHARVLEDEWPLGNTTELMHIQAQMLASTRDQELDMHWQRLFIGPNHLEAPPWGSVYLDKEQVIFGDSAVELGLFLKQVGIQINTGMNEPEDHIGLMFWYIATFIENADDEKLKALLQEHMLPWAYRYLELLKIHAKAPFFEGLSDLAVISLQAGQQLFGVDAAEKQLFL